MKINLFILLSYLPLPINWNANSPALTNKFVHLFATYVLFILDTCMMGPIMHCSGTTAAWVLFKIRIKQLKVNRVWLYIMKEGLQLPVKQELSFEVCTARCWNLDFYYLHTILKKTTIKVWVICVDLPSVKSFFRKSFKNLLDCLMSKNIWKWATFI